MSCERTPEFLGAYVLGALDPAERAASEEHLGSCPDCTAELAEFRELPGHLDRVRPEDLQPAAPPPDLYDRVAAAAGRTRILTRTRWVVAAAAVVLVAAGGVTRLVVEDDTLRGEATEGPVTMSVVATERHDGSVLEVTVGGLSGEETCRLLVVDGDGDRHHAGEWTATYDGENSYDTWTEVEPGSMTDVVLVDGDGDELIRVGFPE